MKLFLWLNVYLRTENKIVINMISFIIGLLAVIILVYSFNRFSKKKSFSKRIIYILIMINLMFLLGITELFESFMKNIDLGKFDRIHLNQYSSSLNLNLIYPFIGLIYYLRKLKNNKITVANTI